MAVVLFAILVGVLSVVDGISDDVKLTIAAAVAYFGTLVLPLFFSRGQTFGKRIQKMRVVDAKTDEPAPLLLEILRELVKGTLMIVTVGFYLIVCGIMFNARKDGRVIHDFIFRTRVVCLTRFVSDREGTFIDQTAAMKKRMEGSTHD
jgi:uncharacterized RDD family membrane protein YckC